jgi:hypothetical protein
VAAADDANKASGSRRRIGYFLLRRRLYCIDDEIYERADFRSAFLVATATTIVNFRRDLL